MKHGAVCFEAVGRVCQGDLVQLTGRFCEERFNEVLLEELVRLLMFRKAQTESESEEHRADRNKFDPSRNRPANSGESVLHTSGGGR